MDGFPEITAGGSEGNLRSSSSAEISLCIRAESVSESGLFGISPCGVWQELQNGFFVLSGRGASPLIGPSGNKELSLRETVFAGS